MLGGDLQTEATPDGGVHYGLILPLVWVGEGVLEARHVRAAAAGVPAEAGGSPHGRVLRVVVADDHNIVREGLVTLLQEERDFEVVGEAADGDEAVEQALATCPDVVIMDVTMPRRDGIEATRMIKQRQPDAVVIALSFHDDQNIARAMTDAGAAAYLRKDGPSEDLFAAIRQLCCTA